MTETPPQQGPHADDGFDRDALRDFERLRRSRSDRKVAGVAGGLGRHLNIDPTILRVLFVVLVFFGGAGLLLYGAAWLIVPEEGSEEATIKTSPGTRNTVSATEAVQAPVALTSARAETTRRWPRSITTSRQTSLRSARTQRAPVRISAPRSAASTALSTTRRESSTTQSEYSKAVPNGRFSGLPIG